MRPTNDIADRPFATEHPRFSRLALDKKFSLPLHFSPILLTVVLTASLVLVESFFLVFLPIVTQLPASQAALMAAAAVIAILIPAVYFLVLRPITVYVTRHLKAEQHLRTSQGELIARLEDRTRQLEVANRAVEQKVEQLKKSEIERDHLSSELERRLGEFAQAVTHDIGTPMTAIAGYAQILQRDFQGAVVDGRWVASVDAILRGSQRLNAAVRQLVDSLLVGTAELKMDAVPVQLHTMVTDLKKHLGQNDLGRVEVHMPEGLPPVLADRSRLVTVLLNLVDNALKFSSRTATICLCAGLSDSQMLISVSDKGEGICRQDLPHVFDRFTKVGEARKAGGLGLGLYITRMLVEAQGGRIWADSEVGKGSTFHITLPLA